MPSPLIKINNTNISTGYDVSGTSTLVVSLQDFTGVHSWKIFCIGCDEKHTVEEMNSNIIYNYATKYYTISFSAKIGCAAIYRSEINNNKNINDTYVEAFSTNFAIYGNLNGRRLVALGETTEGSSSGWIKEFNSLLGSGLPIDDIQGTAYFNDISGDSLEIFKPTDLAHISMWFQPIDSTQYLTKATQISESNSDFSVWTGVNPDATPTGWSKFPGTGVSANHIEANGSACRIIADGTAATRVYKTAIIGNRYRYNFTVSALTTGNVISISNESDVVTDLGANSFDITVTAAAVGLKRYSGATDCTFTDLTFDNLSRSGWNDLVDDNRLSQATATAQPYYDRGVYFAIEDRMTLDAALSYQHNLHNGAGITICAKVHITNLNTINGIMGSMSDRDLSTLGFVLYVDATGYLHYTLSNGAGIAIFNLVSPLPVFTDDSTKTITIKMDNSRAEMRVDNVLLISNNYPITAHEDTDAAYTLHVGNVGGTSNYGLDGYFGDIVFVNSFLDDLDTLFLENYITDEKTTTFAPNLELRVTEVANQSTYYMTESDCVIFIYNPAFDVTTVVVPEPVAGKIIYIFDKGCAAPPIIAPLNEELICGADHITMTADSGYALICDGSDWYTLHGIL